MRLRTPPFTIAAAGSVAGALDLLSAMVLSMYYGGTPVRLLQTIASGLLGTSTYECGIAAASLGFVLHFLWSFLFAGVYWFASLRFPRLVALPIRWGLVYGLAVYTLMNFVVLPLSAYPHPFRFTPVGTSVVLFANVFLFGLPIALITSSAQADSHRGA